MPKAPFQDVLSYLRKDPARHETAPDGQDLNSDQFAVRKTATAELERFSTGHEELLRKALEKAGSLEVRQRLEQILRRLDPQRLRLSRMLEVLERIGTVQARQFLQTLANQTEDAELSRDATASFKAAGARLNLKSGTGPIAYRRIQHLAAVQDAWKRPGPLERRSVIT